MLTRNLDKALAAYRNRDPGASKKAHNAEAREEHRREQGQFIKSLVYGGLDGIITTFAVVAGVAGAALQPSVVLILGFANLIADGLSMAIGDYLSTRAEQEYEAAERKREEWEVDNYPEGEKREMVELYMEKGLSQDQAEAMMAILSKNRDAWVDVMMVEELGILGSDDSPIRNALATFFSFAVFGFVPLLTYIVAAFLPFIRENSFLAASVLTGLTLFVLGALKTRITTQKWFRSGLEMLLVGGAASAAAYGIGYLLSRIV
jgi:VIT1/CCC1 family predicted Fe2+/Mn2+ transporter